MRSIRRRRRKRVQGRFIFNAAAGIGRLVYFSAKESVDFLSMKGVNME